MHNAEDLSMLSLNDFGELFGTDTEDIGRYCPDGIGELDFRYRKLAPAERDYLILSILKKIDSYDLPTSGQNRKADWERGWEENLREFIDSGYDFGKLVPKYFKKNVPVRLNGDYVMPVDSDFVLNCTKVFRNWLFGKYFKGVNSIYEFGCGSAAHLAFLATIYPDKKLYGLDWARPSQEIIRLLAEHYGWKIEGHYFDIFAPDPNLHLDVNSVVFTFGAMEQVGTQHEVFLQFLLRESPFLCINVECLLELYNPSYLTDYLACKYHERRNYLRGYLTRLRELESEGHIEILKTHHQRFGNIYNDSHSYVIWKPRQRACSTGKNIQ